MSWEERDYTWSGERGAWRENWARLLPPAGTLVLVVAHLSGWILVTILNYAVTEGAARALQLDSELRPWAILTHPIATTSGLLSGLAILCLWPLAARIEEQMGRSRMLALYFSGNILAALGFIAVAGFSPKHGTAPLNLPSGALAAWSLAAWRSLPLESLPIFGRFIPLKHVIAWLAIGAAVICVAGFRDGALAWLFAAVCGAAIAPVIEAAAAVRWRRRMAVITSGRSRRAADFSDSVESKRPASEPRVDRLEGDLDELLAKISKSGLASLTSDERSRLEVARLKRLRRERGD